MTANLRVMGTPVQLPSASTLQLVVPAGAQVGDLLLAWVHSYGTRANGSPTGGVPAGWINVGPTPDDPDNNTTYGENVRVYSKRCTSSDPGATYVWQGIDNHNQMAGVIGAYQNALAIDVSAQTFANSNNQSGLNAAAVTTGFDNELVIQMWLCYQSNSTLTAPATGRLASPPAANAGSLAISDQVQASAGQSGHPTCTGTYTYSTSGPGGSSSTHTAPVSSYWLSVTVAVRSDSPPNAPNITSPANGFHYNRATDLVIQAPFSDPDTNDMPSQLIRRIRSSTVTPTPAWTVTKTSGTAQQTIIPGGTLASDDYEVQIAYRDSFGIPVNDSDLQFSPSLHISPRDAPGAGTFTSPANGAIIPSNTQTFTIASDQPFDSGSWRELGDDGSGNPDPSQVINGPHPFGPDDRTFTATGLPNNTTVHTLFYLTRQGVPSAETDNVNPVGYTPPPAAEVFVEGRYADANDGEFGPDDLHVTWSTPAPASGKPAAVGGYVLLSEDGGATSIRVTELLAASDEWTYWFPRSGQDYAFAVVTVAANGTETTSPFIDTSLGAYGEGTYGTGPYGGGG